MANIVYFFHIQLQDLTKKPAIASKPVLSQRSSVKMQEETDGKVAYANIGYEEGLYVNGRFWQEAKWLSFSQTLLEFVGSVLFPLYF